MVTSVQLGNFYTVNGRNVLGGSGGSGIDSQSLIKSLTDAKALPATKLQDQVKLNDSRSKALSDYKTLLSKFQDAANFLRNPPGVANETSNAFAYTKANVSYDTSSGGTAPLTVTTSPGATQNTYLIDQIISTAKATKQTTNNFSISDADQKVVYSSAGAGQFGAGTIVVKGATITLNDGDSLNSVASKFNAVSATTKIAATVVKVSTGTYSLLFSSTQTGTDAAFNLTSNATVTSAVPADVLTHLTFTNTQTASNASFILDGVTFTRQTNAISDVINGLTFNLQQATTTDITVTVDPDTDTAKNAIINFANTYNDLRKFYAKQTEVGTDGKFKDTAVLANSDVLRTSISTIGDQVSRIVAGLSGNYTRLSDLNVTSTDLPATDTDPLVRNILTIDEGKLGSALSSNFSDIRKVFEYTFTSSDSRVKVFSRSNNASVQNFDLTIDPDSGIYRATYTLSGGGTGRVDLDATVGDSGITLRGSSVAKETKQRTGQFAIPTSGTQAVYASPVSGQFGAGTIRVKGIDITLDDGDSLDTVANKFNAVKSTTGIDATVVKVSDGFYRIDFRGTQTGIANGFDLSSPTTVTNATPSTVLSNLTFTTTQAAADATTSALDGLVLVYGATTATTSTIKTTQGIGDLTYNFSSDILKRDTGQLDQEIKSITDATTRYNDNIKKINDQVDTYREQLVSKFAALESAISKVNTLLQSLDANQQAKNNSSN